MVAPSSKFYGKIWACFCFNFKTVFSRGFILKPTKRAQTLLKNGASDFQNGPPFDRWHVFM